MDEEISEIIKDLSEAFFYIVSTIYLIIKVRANKNDKKKKRSNKSKSRGKKK